MKLLAPLLILFLVPLGLPAATITTPSGALSGDMPGGNRYPFDPFDASSMRYQQEYAASFFTSFGSPMRITEIRFRPDSGLSAISGPFAATIRDIEILMSTTSQPSEGLLSQFSRNEGSDLTSVFPRGFLSLSSAYLNDGAGARVFDIRIPLVNPFYYDPAKGNLVLEVKNYSGDHLTSPNYIAFDAAYSNDDGISRVWSPVVNSDFGTPQTLGLVTQFEVIVIPEPSVLSLLALAMICAVIPTFGARSGLLAKFRR